MKADRLSQETTLVLLDDIGLLRFHGPDVIGFLQGYLTSDAAELGDDPEVYGDLQHPGPRSLHGIRVAGRTGGLPRAAPVSMRHPAGLPAALSRVLENGAVGRIVLRSRPRCALGDVGHGGPRPAVGAPA